MRSLNALVLATALLLLPAAAQAEKSWDDMSFGEQMDASGSWFLVGFEYGSKMYSGVDHTVGGYEGGEHDGDFTQSHWSIFWRGILWNPPAQTFLGHVPGLNIDFWAGGVGDPSGYDEGQDPYLSTDLGFDFGVKVGTPWTLYRSDTLRIGTGFGFGIAYDLHTVELKGYEWSSFDLDCHWNTVVGYAPTGDRDDLLVEGSYDYALFGLAYDAQHRVRVMVAYSWFGVGVHFERAMLQDDGAINELYGMVGFRI